MQFDAMFQLNRHDRSIEVTANKPKFVLPEDILKKLLAGIERGSLHDPSDPIFFMLPESEEKHNG